MILVHSQTGLFPVTSMKQYRLRIQGKTQKNNSKTLTGEETGSKKQLLRELKSNTTTDEPLQFSTGTSRDVPAFYKKQTETSSESSSEEEEEKETPLQKQIQLLRKRQRILKHHILKRLKQSPE